MPGGTEGKRGARFTIGCSRSAVGDGVICRDDCAIIARSIGFIVGLHLKPIWNGWRSTAPPCVRFVTPFFRPSFPNEN